MSCTCTHIDNWNPCNCGCNSTITTFTTSTTTTCDGEKCEVAIDPNCIIYCGPDLPCYGIETGDSAADILEIILSALCTTTTTTIAPPQSKCIIFTRETPGGNPKITWTSPDGTVNYEVPWTWGGSGTEFHTCGYDVEVPYNISFTEGDNCDDNNPCPCNCIQFTYVGNQCDDGQNTAYTNCDGENIDEPWLFPIPGQIKYKCGYNAYTNCQDIEITTNFTNCVNCNTDICLTIVDLEEPDPTCFVTFRIITDADLIDDLNTDYDFDVNQPMWEVVSSVPVTEVLMNYLSLYIGWNATENRWEMINDSESNFLAATTNLEGPIDSSWTKLTPFTNDFTLSTVRGSCGT